MANGHVHSLNPFDSDEDSMEDTEEFRIIMAYAQRRPPNKAESPAQDSATVQNGGSHPKGTSSAQTPAEATSEAEKTTTKKKKGLRSWILKCIKPQKDEEPGQSASNQSDVYKRSGCAVEIPSLHDEEEEEEQKLKELAGRLTAIVKEIPFTSQIPTTSSEIETDSPEDEVERVIGLILREAGDRLNDEELKNADIPAALFGKYSFFEDLITKLLKRMGLVTAEPDALGPQASPKTQIAVTCEVCRRLSAVDTLPMNRMLDHGARYLQKYYSSWAQQQGGYEEAFHDDDDDDVQ